MMLVNEYSLGQIAKIAQDKIVDGFAGEFCFEEPPLIQSDYFDCVHYHQSKEELKVETRHYESGNFIIKGMGDSAAKALDDFVNHFEVTFPWRSLRDRFTIAWRKEPRMTADMNFETGSPEFRISARLALILDWKKETSPAPEEHSGQLDIEDVPHAPPEIFDAE